MTSMSDDKDITEAMRVAASLVAAADHNSERLERLPGHVLGVQALNHRIRTERNVLIKGFKRPRWLKLEHVVSSNLHHLGAVVQIASALSDKVDAVLKKYRDTSSNVPVFVDVVANGGLLWIKVVCRCPNTLQLAHCTGGRTGERAPIQQVKTLLSLASQHPVLYSTPKVAFIFCKGVGRTVFEALRKEGAIVCTPFVLPDSVLPASRYLPQDDEEGDGELLLVSDGAADYKLEQNLANTTNLDVPCSGAVAGLHGPSNAVGNEARGNYGPNHDDLTRVDACQSVAPCGDNNSGKGDRINSSLCKHFNDDYLENLRKRKMLDFPDVLSNDNCGDRNSTGELEENSHVKQLQVGNLIDHIGALCRNKDNCEFYEEGIVLRCADQSVLELGDTLSKKPWPLCSNDEIIEIAQALRDYADKSDWARKAKKSQTFVSLCQNSHYTASQSDAQEFNNDVSNCHDNKDNYNNRLNHSLRQNSEHDSVSSGNKDVLQKYLGDNLSNRSWFPPVTKEVLDASCEESSVASSALRTSCNKEELNYTRNIMQRILATKTVLPNTCTNSDHPPKTRENSVISGVDNPNSHLASSGKGEISQIAVVDANRPNKLRGTVRPTEGLRDVDAGGARRHVCLDVPTMIAYIANTSNGFSHCHFEDGFLRQQALWEQDEPIKPVIEKYWQDCEVLVCKEALKRFESIVGVMAGEQELLRARELVSSVTIVPDRDELKGVLQACGGITVSSRIIFGTALHHRAPLITANRRFVRSAHTQGVSVAALLHNPRALTEQKQLLAVGCDTPLGGEDVSGDTLDDTSSLVPDEVAASPDPLAVHNKLGKNACAGGRVPCATEPRKQVLSCLSSARYLSTVTPVSLLSD